MPMRTLCVPWLWECGTRWGPRKQSPKAAERGGGGAGNQEQSGRRPSDSESKYVPNKSNCSVDLAPFEGGPRQQAARAYVSGGRGQIQCLGQGNEPDAQMLEFLWGGHLISYRRRAGPAATPSADIDLSAAGRLDHYLTSRRSPAPEPTSLIAERIVQPRPAAYSQGATLQGQPLVVVVETRAYPKRGKVSCRFPPCLAKNVIGFWLGKSLFGGHVAFQESRLLAGHRACDGSLPGWSGLTDPLLQRERRSHALRRISAAGIWNRQWGRGSSHKQVVHARFRQAGISTRCSKSNASPSMAGLPKASEHRNWSHA